MKFILISLLLLLGLTASSQGDSASLKIKKYDRLRVCMILTDTTAHPCPCSSSLEYSMYIFQIKNIFQGVSEVKTIGVCASKSAILKFNPLKETGKDYWWVLYKECMLSNFPVYLHSGNF